MELTRRESLALGLGLAVSACAPLAPLGPRQAPDSLDSLARAGGRRFGSTIGRRGVRDPRYQALIAGQCGLIVPENELKWVWTRPTATSFNFTGADLLLDWAEENDLAFRGHTLLWHHVRWMPRWTADHDFGANPRAEAERMLREHISTVCTRYGRRIHSYDVVNEAVDNETGEMRQTSLSRAMGSAEATVDLAFHVARETAPPGTELVYNDYMSWSPGNAAHRVGVLRLLAGFKRRGVPVDTLGVQAHIGGGGSDLADGFGSRQEAEWRRFLDEAVGMGYKLIITEFDVNDRNIPGDIPARDRAVADYARAYLDLMLSYAQLGDILAWGMSDNYSWLQGNTPRADGLPKRCCPYDSHLRPKPLREAIAGALRGATPHRA